MTPNVSHPVRGPISDFSGSARRPGVLVAAPADATCAALSARLEAGGFNVWTADNWLKAFDTFLRHTGEIDVVLLDAALPDVPGLVRRLRANFPGIPCAYFAGAADDELRRLGAEPAPLTFPALLETLHELAASDTGVPARLLSPAAI